MKTAILISVLLNTFFSCSNRHRHEKITCQGYASNTIPAKIYKGGKNIVNSYLYVYGAERTERLFANGYLNDSAFILPLNISKNLSKFCFVRQDLTIDTIEISYWRDIKMSLDEKCYTCFAKGLQLQALSLGIKKDSSYFNYDKNSTGIIRYNDLILTLK